MINLYTNVTPNLSGTHYYFKDFSKYIIFLASNLFKQIDETRYDINKGFIRVKLGTDLTEANYKEVTYILNTNDNMCYHVTSQIVQSGYAYYGVNVDLWASYIVNAKLKNINVRKCNRKLSDNGILDKISYGEGLTIQPLRNETYSFNDLYVVFVCSESNTAGKTIRYCFADSVQHFAELFNEIAPSGFEDVTSIFSKISNVLSNKQSIELRRGASILATLVLANGEISKAMILHRKYLRFRELDDKILRLSAGSGTQKYIDTLKLVENNISFEDITLHLDSNYKYTIGVLGNGIDIDNKVKDITIRYTFFTATDNLYVTVSIDDKEKDISHAFTLDTVTAIENNNSITLNNVLGLMSSIIKTGIGVMTENPIIASRGITGIGSSVGGALSSGNNKNINILSSNSVGLGASINYLSIEGLSITNVLYCPFKIMFSISLNDEYKRLRKTGAYFNEYIDELEDIFDYALLGTGEINDDTYIVASLDANEIPTSAVDYIEGRFTSGLYLQYLV